MKLSLEDIRNYSYGGRFRGHSTHPRSWEKKGSPGNGFHTLYFSKKILKQINIRRGRRQKVPPRVWDSKRKEWIYKYRHQKVLLPETSNFTEAKYNSKGEVVPTNIKEKSKFMSDYYYSDTESLPIGANRTYRRGGKAHGRTYKIRREIFDLFRVHDEFLHTIIINPKDLKRDRGKLSKVAILMPNFSVAVKELLFHKVTDEQGFDSRKGLLLYFKNKSTNPKSILSLFPKRGPGSGESRYLITKFLYSSSQLDNFEDKLQDLIDITWRSVLVNLIEMHHMNKNEERPESKLETIDVIDSCEDDSCNSPYIMEITEDGDLVARECMVCGLEQSVLHPPPDLTVRCKAFDNAYKEPGRKIRCINRTTHPTHYCPTHRPKIDKNTHQYYE